MRDQKNIEIFQQILFSDESCIYKEIKNNFDVSVDELL